MSETVLYRYVGRMDGWMEPVVIGFIFLDSERAIRKMREIKRGR